jgi:hypothetical protein
MTAKPKQQAEPFDAERFRIELGYKLERLVSDVIKGWRRCGNAECRRARSCVSDGFECIAKWQESRPPVSPEEAQRQASELKRDLDAYRAGLPLPEKPEPAKKRRRKKPASTSARPAEGDDNRAPVPVAKQPKLAPEQQARIDRAWKEYVASLPAEDAETEEADERKRERRPRITQL